jgi:hypothetical protein
MAVSAVVNGVPAPGEFVEGSRENEVSFGAGTVTSPLGALGALQERKTAVTM